MNKLALSAALMAGLGLAGCNTSAVTPVTAAICSDLTAVQASTLALNANETTALNAAISACNSTSGGTVFSNATVAAALINDAIILQASGLLSDVHITAEAPVDQAKLIKLRLDAAKLRAALVR